MDRQQTQEKELLISGGAGALCYQVGYIQYLIELVGKDRLKEYKLGGISAGAACAGLLHSVIHSDQKVSQIYLEKARKFYEKDNMFFGGFITSGQLIKNLSKEWYQENERMGLPSFSGNVHCYVSCFDTFRFKPMLVEYYDDAHDFSQAIYTSCYIPGICGLGLYTRYRDKICVDGGLTRPIPYKKEENYKIFLNVLPDNWLFTGTIPKNTFQVNMCESGNINFPVDYWLWSEEWADMMFLKGYLAAQKQKETLKQAFGMDGNE